MNDIEELLKSQSNEDMVKVPDSVLKRIDETLDNLPEKKEKNVHILNTIAKVAVIFIFFSLVILPNASVAYEQALEEIPVIGHIVKVVTIRNYFYEDDNHELDIEVPKIVDEGNKAESDDINGEIEQLKNTLIDRFYDDLGEYGKDSHFSTDMSYDVITNTESWFTLRINVTETAASSNQYYRFYHIDRNKNQIIYLKDLFTNDNYIDVISTEIQNQMIQQMEKDNSVQYWLDEEDNLGENFAAISPTQNYYWDEEGNLVIVFDKYEIAPGSMGTPEFVISRNVLKNILKEEYTDV